MNFDDYDLNEIAAFDPLGKQRHRLFVIAGEKYDLVDLATRCMAIWNDFLTGTYDRVLGSREVPGAVRVIRVGGRCEAGSWAQSRGV